MLPNQKVFTAKEDPSSFKIKALEWASLFNTACYFDSNEYSDPYSAFDVLIAAGSIAEINNTTGNALNNLQEFLNIHQHWALGFLSYDLKNEIEDLQSKNPDYLYFPDLYFFVPQHLILIKSKEITIFSNSAEEIFSAINDQKTTAIEVNFNGKIQHRFSKDEYIKNVEELQSHILRGDIYEVNFCQEFYAENTHIDPLAAFKSLNEISPTPFANFFKVDNRYIISATPERFLSKRANKLISQPIKGTAKRTTDAREDLTIKETLRNDEKERSENVMIVDLVRNDLTKCAIPGTVQVEELFGIYSYKQVHQMISTVVCQIENSTKIAEIFKAVFPMGSMTGAPKVSAIKLIDDYERTKRGVFSGAVGYFSPDGDFDFNVIIRTLLYNASEKYLSYQVGGAITYESDPEKEYEECLLKAQAILEMLQKTP